MNEQSGDLIKIKPVRELQSNEEIEDIFRIADGDSFLIGFMLKRWETSSHFKSIVIGAEIIKE